MPAVPNQPGDYVITTGRDDDGNPIQKRFNDVTFAYGPDDTLSVMRGVLTIATFRWWDSIELDEAS